MENDGSFSILFQTV